MSFCNFVVFLLACFFLISDISGFMFCMTIALCLSLLLTGEMQMDQLVDVLCIFIVQFLNYCFHPLGDLFFFYLFSFLSCFFFFFANAFSSKGCFVLL